MKRELKQFHGQMRFVAILVDYCRAYPDEKGIETYSIDTNISNFKSQLQSLSR